MTDLRRLWRRHRLRVACERRLDGIDFAGPFDLDRILSAVAARRGRPIVVSAMETPDRAGRIFGVLIEEDEMDIILHDPDIAGVHRAVVVLHELAHLVCGHTREVVPTYSSARGAFHGYSRENEEEAELLASLFYVRAARAATGLSEDTGDVFVDRFQSMFGRPRRDRGNR